jgi:hypothetical protein
METESKVLMLMETMTEVDARSDEVLKANFGYSDAGIENLKQNAKDIREEVA